jgi:hypothetical protein
MSEEALKDIHYFVTSITTVATVFASWQTIKNQLNIYRKR